MTVARCSVVLLIALAAALLQPPPAHADPERVPDGLLPAPERTGLGPEIRVHEILDSLDTPESGWLFNYLQRVGISRYGLTYTQEFELGDGMRFRVGGPRMRGMGDLGLSIEVRF